MTHALFLLPEFEYAWYGASDPWDEKPSYLLVGKTQPSKGIVERWVLHVMALQHLTVLLAAQVYGLLFMYWLPAQNLTVS